MPNPRPVVEDGIFARRSHVEAKDRKRNDLSVQEEGLYTKVDAMLLSRREAALLLRE